MTNGESGRRRAALKIEDHSQEYNSALEDAIIKGLTACGLTMERYAKENLTRNGSVDTGLLRNSITFALAGESAAIGSYKASKPGGGSGSYSGQAPSSPEFAVYAGSNVEYAAFVELGTGAKNTPGGRPGSWGYIDDEGRAHHTGGQRAKPYLKPALTEHKEEYRKLITDALKGGQA